MSTRSGQLPGVTPTTQTHTTFKTRSAEATRSLHDSLHLPSEMNDPAVLSTALAEVVADENRRSPNPRFALAVRQRYSELLLARSATTRSSKSKESLPPLVPLERPAGQYATRIRLDPFAPPDPAAIVRVYGRAQLERALQDYMLDSLKETAALIEREHPGTKPTNRGQKQSVIDYIVKYSDV